MFNNKGDSAVLRLTQSNERIQFMDGYDLYPDKYVLLGHMEDRKDENEIESGIVLATGEENDDDAIWDLYADYLTSGKHGRLLVFYYGNVNASGVYI